MTSVSMLLRSLRSSLVWSMSWSAMTPIGSLNSEWMVWPPTFSAATPVGAAITIDFSVFHDRWLSSVDLPVPARPVTNTWSRVCSISSNTARCSGESESPPIRIPSLARPAGLL